MNRVFVLIAAVAFIAIAGCTQEAPQASAPLPTPFISTSAPAPVPTTAVTTLATAAPPVAKNISEDGERSISASGYNIRANDTFYHDKYSEIYHSYSDERLDREYCWVGGSFDFVEEGDYPAVKAEFTVFDDAGLKTDYYQEVYSLATDMYGGDKTYYENYHVTSGSVSHNFGYCPRNFKIELTGIRV